VLIFIHELGHYITARIFDVHIEEFSIGMGPKLFSKTSRKTGIVYSMRALPIGGYVAMVGEDGESDDERALCSKPVWQRLIIMSAGAFMNILLGVVLSFVMIVSSQAIGGTTIAEFVDGSVSQSYGLREGDRIISIDGTNVHISTQVAYEISRCAAGDSVDIEVERDGNIINVTGVKFGAETQDGVSLGICDFRMYRVDKNVSNVLKHTFYTSTLSVKMIWQSLGDLITGRYGIEAVSGPIGVTGSIASAAKQSTISLLYLSSVIAMNLGIFNLLPIPALDGGRILFLLIELIFRRPVNRKIEGYVHAVGITILFAFMAIITVKDILKLL